jgi:hypothetical protein
MSLDVALQSVAFYVLSCTTCTKIYHRHKAKQVAKRERAEKQALETEQPGLYRHPSPFSTNPYWDEEIMLGPGPPKRKGGQSGSKNTSSKALNQTGQGSSVTSSGCISTDPESSPTIVSTVPRLSGENWNRKRYQREDEELWGIDTNRVSQKIRDAIAKTESSVGSKMREIGGRLSKSGPSKEEERSPYYIARNPPVNDLHPPVVSTQPRDKGATAWMLQPPPSARVMEGKERANSTRSRSVSRTSSRLGVDGMNLSRQVTGRAVEEKIRRGENPSDLELRPLSSRPNSRSKTPGFLTPQSEPISRGRSHSMESSGSSDGGIRRKRKPPPFTLAVDETSSKYTLEHIPLHSDDTLVTTRPESRDITRPPLATIVSSSEATPKAKLTNSPGNDPESRQLLPSPDLDKARSLRVPSVSDLNSMPAILPAIPSKFPGGESYKFPRRESQEENTRTNPEPIS